jgi:hypothetical protein
VNIYTLISLGGILLAATTMTDDRATKCNASLVSTRSSLRWVAQRADTIDLEVSASVATTRNAAALKAVATRRANLALLQAAA